MRGRYALVLAALGAVCGGCPRTAATPHDAGFDAGLLDSSPADLPPPQHDAGPWRQVGARWYLGDQSGCFYGECLNPPCPCEPLPVMLVRARQVEGGIELRLGTGEPVPGQPDTFTFTDSATPGPIRAVVGAATVIDGRVAVPFESVEAFEWQEALVVGQPAIVMRDVRISGTLDADGVPTSVCPTGTALPPGRLAGCVTRESVVLVYCPETGNTFNSLIEARGCEPDCQSSDKGTLDGYLMDGRWGGWAVAIRDPPDGG